MWQYSQRYFFLTGGNDDGFRTAVVRGDERLQVGDYQLFEQEEIHRRAA
jgi:hypothetical protein